MTAILASNVAQLRSQLASFVRHLTHGACVQAGCGSLAQRCCESLITLDSETCPVSNTAAQRMTCDATVDVQGVSSTGQVRADYS
jgi:hypothetical protein